MQDKLTISRARCCNNRIVSFKAAYRTILDPVSRVDLVEIRSVHLTSDRPHREGSVVEMGSTFYYTVLVRSLC